MARSPRRTLNAAVLEPVLAKADSQAGLALAGLLRQIGLTLVMTVGGASGPLYGTLLLELGKALQGQPEPPDRSSLAVKARGLSDSGKAELVSAVGLHHRQNAGRVS